jgi:deazaflavin-dependent oxidoreductase (nitroreductase family)
MPPRSRPKASPGRAEADNGRADAAPALRCRVRVALTHPAVRSLSVLRAALRRGHLSAAVGTVVDALGEQLAGWGKVVRLDLRGRVSGTGVSVAVGYLEAPDGSLLVAAGDPDADWARNLEADPQGRATIGERTFEVVGERLQGRAAAEAIVGLILKYGTSAERLGRGPVFRLVPVDQVVSEPGGTSGPQ